MNGAINVPCKILKEVLSSASEAKLAGLYHNGKEAVPERITLEELGHPQSATPIVTDNSTASGIANDSVKNDPKPWTCVFIGSATASAKANSLSTGTAVSPTEPTTLPNITPISTIVPLAPSTSKTKRNHTRPTICTWYFLKTRPRQTTNRPPLAVRVLIPTAACACQPFYAPRRPSCPARCASFSANRRH
jgi:hypothetical protein